MPALPAATEFTGSAVTEGQFKTAMSNQRGFLAGLLGTTGNADAALAALGALGGQSVSKTAAYTVLAADRGKVFECSGTFSLTLTAAATLGAGFSFIVANTGAGIITVDPNASELINGGATVNIAAGAWAVISCNGTAFMCMSAGSIPSGTLIGFQVFTASGTYTKATNNPSFVVVESIGGGGGGGGSTSTSGSAGGGGGGGGYAIKKISATSLAAGETVTIGGGGTGGSNTGGTGGTGGTSSFGAFCSATGGVGGVGGSGASTDRSGGAGGSGSGGDVNQSGGAGGISSAATSATNVITGIGGCSQKGGGASSRTGSGTGNNASANSGGGGSGASGNGATGSTGGTGGTGIVIVWEYA